ncbi:hypothetical protein ABQF17_15030 [Mycolicibacterium elephantis]
MNAQDKKEEDQRDPKDTRQRPEPTCKGSIPDDDQEGTSDSERTR